MFDYYDIESGEGLTDYDLHERYDLWLDEVYGCTNIAGIEYGTAYALRSVSDTDYRVSFHNWVDSEIGETISETNPHFDDI